MNLNVSTPRIAFKGGSISNISKMNTSLIKGDYEKPKNIEKMKPEELQRQQIEVMSALYTQMVSNTLAVNKLAESMNNFADKVEGSMDTFSKGVADFNHRVIHSDLSRY